LDRYKEGLRPLLVCKDFQKELPMPKLMPQPTDQYRRRKLYLHNFGNWIANSGIMHCFLWDEWVAAKTSDDVASVWWHRLKMYKAMDKDYEHVHSVNIIATHIFRL
jgi:hypothetical protein